MSLTTKNVDRPEHCPSCDGSNFSERWILDEFLHGVAEPIVVRANIPVVVCNRCGFEFTDERAEDLRQEALCSQLGLLNPSEIRAIRAKYVMTQAQFAAITGFGETSLKRWESGAILQNVSTDRFLRLLRDESVMEQLRALGDPARDERPWFSELRTPLTPEQRRDARAFKLRLN